MAHILERLLYINGKDVYTAYGAFLCEDKDGENTNYAELMKPAAMKPYVAVNFREQDGEKLPDRLLPRFAPREITLQFAICAPTEGVFFTRYVMFVNMLKSGWIELFVPEINKFYRIYYESCAEYTQITPFGDGQVAAKFKVKFKEPIPTV